MIESDINKRYCQSCGMPLRFDVEKYLGTNSDGSRSDEYCYYCLKDGKYIVDIPMSTIYYKLTNYSKQHHKGTFSFEMYMNRPTSTLRFELESWKRKLIYRLLTEKTVERIRALYL